jgi:pSer/pThr/pTyr-binding forkhead associated (FHA) protein
MRGELEVIRGPDKGRTFPLAEGQILPIGRGPTTETRLTDPYVSRLHCQVQVENETITLTDLGGSGGVLYQGVPVTTVTLRHDDTFAIGDTEIRLRRFDAHDDRTIIRQTPRPAPPAAKLPDHVTELSGAVLDRYDVGMRVAMGHSSVVYQARDRVDGQTVALKVLRPEFTQSEEQMQRFARSMKVVQNLRHPHLVSVLGSGSTGPFVWAVLEWVEGESVAQVIRKIGTCGILDWRHALRIGLHLARALAFAHERGIVHRNVTPANALIRATDRVTKLGDLMLAKGLESADGDQITRCGELVGDLAYMSPEQTYSSQDVGPRSDLYSLGATIYALLTGRPPCLAATQLETIHRIRNVPPEKPSTIQLSVPEAFENLVLRLLAKRAEERCASASDLIGELEAVARKHGLALD